MGQRVDFLVAGAQKAGTSALHRYLSRHPNLFLPSRKELHFFDNDSLIWPNETNPSRPFISKWRAWQRDPYHRYHQAFQDAPSESVWGEATPIYMYWQPCIARISHYHPKIRLILVLRNPITRAFSHWNMERLRGDEHLGFLDALLREEEQYKAVPGSQHRVISYVARGNYINQIQRIWGHLPPSQTLILKQEELLNEPAATLARVHDHLGVDQQPFNGGQCEHALPYETTMSDEARGWLKQKFEGDIHKLEQMLSWDCSDWLGS